MRGVLTKLVLTSVMEFCAPTEVLAGVTRDAIFTYRPGDQECTSIDHAIDTPGEFTAIEPGIGCVTVARGLGSAQYPLSNLSAPQHMFDGLHADSVTAVANSGGNRLIATGGSDAAIAIWNTDEQSAMVIDNAHSDWIRQLFFVTDEIGTLVLVSVGDDGIVNRWDAMTCRLISRSKRLTAPVRASAFASGPKMLLLGTEDGYFHILNVARATIEETDHFKSQINASPTAMSWSNDARYFAVAFEDEIVRLYDVEHQSIIATCAAHYTKRLCVSFMTNISSVMILASPPPPQIVAEVSHGWPNSRRTQSGMFLRSDSQFDVSPTALDSYRTAASSVFIICSAASDGTIVLWVHDPRSKENKSLTKEKLRATRIQLGLGAIVDLAPLRLSLA
jgi:WD40 repeat protein